MSQTEKVAPTTGHLVYVTIACCKDGLCVDCHRRGNHGDRTKRARRNWSHLPVDMEFASRICEGWRDLAPEIVGAPLAELIPPLTQRALEAMSADARLRNAAPDLCEALLALRVRDSEGLNESHCWCPANHKQGRAIKDHEHTAECCLSRAAIAKAEGGR